MHKWHFIIKQTSFSKNISFLCVAADIINVPDHVIPELSPTWPLRGLRRDCVNA